MRSARITALTLIVLVAVPYAASATDRMVVAELYTAQNCPYCAFADPALGNVYGANRGDLAVIAYHPLTYNGEPDPMGIDATDERGARYEVEAYPTVVFDGGEQVIGGYPDVEDDYTGALRNRSEVDAPLKLTVDLDRSGSTLWVWANGTPEEDILNETELTAVLIQDHIEYEGANGLDDFRFVARDLRTKGVEVLEGERFSIRFRFETTSWPEGIRVVAFVQDANTHEIYQGAQKAVGDLSEPSTGPEPGSGSDGLSSAEVGMIGLIGSLVAAGVYLFIDERRRGVKTRRKSSRRKKPRVLRAPPGDGAQRVHKRERGKTGRSKKRRRRR